MRKVASDTVAVTKTHWTSGSLRSSSGTKGLFSRSPEDSMMLIDFVLFLLYLGKQGGMGWVGSSQPS